MQNFTDLFKRIITLTEDRMKHILERPEMISQMGKIDETLTSPELIKRSVSDKNVVIYYKHYQITPVTSKYLAVVIKINKENLIISSYFTDSIKKGEIVWEKN